MSTAGNASQQSKAFGLAPCKSTENADYAASPIDAETAPCNAGEVFTAIPQDNGHEENTADVCTLPVASQIHPCIWGNNAVTRPVMCAAPGFPGSRSESTPTEAGTASGVTPEPSAQRGGEVGATVVWPGEAKQALPAGTYVTVASGNDADFENEESGHDDATNSKLTLQASADGVDKRAHFDVVLSTRALMREIAQRRRQRQDTEPGAETVEKYKRQAKLLLQRAQQLPQESGSLPSLCVTLANYASKANSFYTMRSAAVWMVQSKVSKLLAQQDNLKRGGCATQEWVNCVTALGVAAQLLRDILGFSLEDARALSGAVKIAPNSKRQVLKKAETDWRDKYFEVTARSKKYRHGALLQGLCGMRPLELERGVIVRRRGAMVAIKILGAKVRKTAGQEWRGMFIPAERFPDWFLEDLGSEPRKYSAPRGAMRSYLKRLSPLIFPVEGDKPPLILSSYVLRHAIATDLRQAGWDSAEIAQVLGERRAETSRWYGLRWTGSKFRKSPEIAIERGTIETSRPVIRRESDFCEKKKEAKAAKRRPVTPSNH